MTTATNTNKGLHVVESVAAIVSIVSRMPSVVVVCVVWVLHGNSPVSSRLSQDNQVGGTTGALKNMSRAVAAELTVQALIPAPV